MDLLVFFCVLSLNLRDILPCVGWRDAGELISAASSLGVAHPTGYSLFVLLEKAALILPAGSAPMRMNWASGVLMSLASALVYRSMIRARLRSPEAALGALLFASLPEFRLESITTEVYPLVLMLLATLLLSTLSMARLTLLSFLIGLAISHHLTILLIIPGLVVAVFWPRRSQMHWPACLALLGIGLSSLLFLPIRSEAHPVRMWADVSTLSEFLRHVSGQAYHGRLTDIPMDRVLSQSARLVKSIANWQHLVLILLVPWAWMCLRRHRRLLAIIVILISPLLLFCVTYDTTDISDFAPHAFPLIAILCLLALTGFRMVHSQYIRLVLLFFCSMIVIVSFMAIPKGSGRNDESTEDFILPMLKYPPIGSCIITGGDNATFLSWSKKIIDAIRPDMLHLGVYRGDRIVNVSGPPWISKVQPWGMPWIQMLPDLEAMCPEVLVEPGLQLDLIRARRCRPWDAWWAFSPTGEDHGPALEFTRRMDELLAEHPLWAVNKDYSEHLAALSNAMAERYLSLGERDKAIALLKWGTRRCPDHSILKRNLDYVLSQSVQSSPAVP